MGRLSILGTIAVGALLLSFGNARTEMGPCVPTGKDIYADEDILICGSGEGSARVITKTASPSKRLALAWRLTNRPPISQPIAHDHYLENVIVRIDDGAILAKTHSAYWHTGDRTEKANVIASWAPDSQLLIAGMQGVESGIVELFAFLTDDSVIGPFDLVKVLERATRAQMKDAKDDEKYSFRITYLPGIAIDNHGLIHASVYLEEQKTREGPIYDLTAKATRTGELIDVKVLSISEYSGPRISVTVH
jgi:hypothetical protein